MVQTTGSELRCPLCRVTFAIAQEFEQHKASPQHRIKWLSHWYQMQRNLLASNKNGVEIYHDGNLNNISYDDKKGTISVLLQPGDQKDFDIVIRNSSDQSAVILRLIESLHASKSITLSDQYDVTKNSKFVRILQGIEYAIRCHVQSPTVGVETVPFAFQFKSEDDSIFFIVRTIEVIIVDSIAKDAGPVAPYEVIKPKYSIRHDRGTYIPGIPIASPGQAYSPHKIRLEEYRYRGSLKHIASKNFNAGKVPPSEVEETNRLRQLMKAGLSENNYQEWFQTLLWLEEMQMEKDIQFYSMQNAKLRKVPPQHYSKANCVELEVLGLAERRPSVLRGDSVFVTHQGKTKPLYEGVVHQVNDKSLYLAFGNEFMRTFIDNMKFSVQFTFNRYPMKVSHRAVVLAKELTLSNFLFPEGPRILPPPVEILPFNRKIQDNRQQMEAVCNIIAGTSKPAPYIIFGPPGTGKTVTVVEAIKQVHRLQPNSRVIAAAPSNSAVDLIAKRLLEHVPKAQMIRMHAQSRPVNTIPAEVLEISNVENGLVYNLVDNQISAYRIILCTFVTAAKIASASLPHGYITHVFLDECGHAMEPECIASLAGIIENEGQVVLAGDPYQLGPVIRNQQCYSSGKLFTNNGLDKSYLERLMEKPIYQPEHSQHNRKVVTKLLNNYRSHKDILKVSNEMFYNNELMACSDQVMVNSLCNWEYLPKRNFPLIFHGVKGKDQREGNSPSYFNPLEVSRVVDYTRKLLESRNPKVHGREIGIITPYRRQVDKIKEQLVKARINKDIKVGSPEEFQGDERRVIIISTVRASSDQLSYDEFFKLGFLRNPKRFNVAVTRAKALLIVIGCPEILQLDRHWRKMLSFVREKGGYCGAPITEETQDINDILARFDLLKLCPVVGEGSFEEVSARELAEAPEWRTEC